MANTNITLNKARNMCNDEFYTQFEDIEKELYHYTDHFKGKVVYCNCDDPTKSNFWKYFHVNFTSLGLKKLISTYYDTDNPVYKMEYTGGNDNDINIGIKTSLKGNGDFRDQECINILKQSDIIVTNPPFSLFREYVLQLMKYEKKFLIIGNMNAVPYKEIFPFIRDNKLWYGISIHSGDVEFKIPNTYENRSKTYRIDENGIQYVRVTGVGWFTNLDISKNHDKIVLCKKYDSVKYPKYDNYDAIEVSKSSDIPIDYDGVMGVPVSFLDKYNPDQFEIVDRLSHPFINGKGVYKRILIRKKGSTKEPQLEKQRLW